MPLGITEKLIIHRASNILLTYQVVKCKIICLIGIVLVVILFIFGAKWASSIETDDYYIRLFALFVVVAVTHELMHALAWWYFGYFAIPIPILRF